MKRSQLAVLVAAVVAVALVAVTRGGGGDESKGGSRPQPAGNALKVSFVYSPEKAKLLAPLIKRFNSTGQRLRGRPVFIAGRVMSSGEAEAKIAHGVLEPVAWSPASSLWGRLLNFEADREYVSTSNPSIVRTPLVIAMWEPMAKALGYPQKKIGFEDIVRLSLSPSGWSAYGRPEFGAFRLVHTNPDFSTSGLSAVVAEYYAATGKKEGLLEEDVRAPDARSTVRAIERSIVHYGDTTLFVAEQMRKSGPAYASAVAMEEATLVDFNRSRGRQQRLVAIYPKEGTFYSDNPFVILDAPWGSRAEREGARLFQRYLADQITPGLAARSGFRPAALGTRPSPPLTRANGVDPRQPTRVLGLPEPRVLDRIRSAWREDRKPANVLIVLDTSGSMAEQGRLVNAKQGVKVFLREVSPNDRVGLTTFSERVEQRKPIARFGRSGRALRSLVTNLVPEGGTAVYDATAAGVGEVRRLRDESRINAVVVLTDGEDTDSQTSAAEVVRELAHQPDSGPHIRVFTIAYSSEAAGSKESLRRIAQASGGQDYTGTVDNIEAVYRSISSFF